MTGSRNRNAWIWVAITAIALASVARVQSGYEIARAYANPVFAYLAAENAAQPLGHLHIGQDRQRASRADLNHANAGLWLELLPVFFVGLLSPLSLLSARSNQSLGRTYAAPFLAALFQRPPPVQLL